MTIFISEVELNIFLGIDSNKIRNLEILIDDIIISHSTIRFDKIKYNVNIIWEKEKSLKLTIGYKFGDSGEFYKVDLDVKLGKEYYQKIFNNFVIENGNLYTC